MDIYVSTTGLDTNDGSADQPYRTVAKALSIQQNGDRVILAPGLYAEAGPLSLANIVQGRLICLQRGEAQISIPSFVGGLSRRQGMLRLTNCPNYVVDGVQVLPPDPADLGVGAYYGVVATNSPGILVTDVRVGPWTANPAVGSSIGGIVLENCRNGRVTRPVVTDLTVTFGPSSTTDPGGQLIGVEVVGAPGSVDHARVENITAINAAFHGIRASSEGASTAPRIWQERCRVRHIEVRADPADQPLLVRGLSFYQTSVPLLMEVRDSHAFDLMPLELSQGLYLDGGEAANVVGFQAFRCAVAIDSRDIAFGSVLDRLTFHQCDIGFRTESPNPPAKITIRNTSLSQLRQGFVVVGLAGSSFLDIDFLNFFEVEDDAHPGAPAWYVAADPLESSFFIGDHIYEYRPLYVSPDVEAPDLLPELVSGLVNRGGDS